MENERVEVIFNFSNGGHITIQAFRKDKIKDILTRLMHKRNENNLDCYCFMYNSKIIKDYNLTINDIEVNNNIQKISIVVIPQYSQSNEKCFVKSKNIICPICMKNSIIKIKNYKISLEECDNYHITSNILLEEFEESQQINKSKIICEKCNKWNRSNILNDAFYKCFSCKKNLCPECKNKHDSNHYIIEYDKINYVCDIHKNYNYEYYCENCHKNLCHKCKSNHESHKIINLKSSNFQDKNDDKESLIIFNAFKNEINGIKNFLNVILENFELYFQIIQNIKDNYNINNINYQIFQNRKNIIIYNKNIIGEMKKIIFEKNINEKFYSLYSIYNKIIKKDIINDINKVNDNFSITSLAKMNTKINEIEIAYKNNKNKEIQLFGEEFIINNKDKCKLKFKDNYFYLQKKYDKSLLKIDEDIFKVKLEMAEEITDLSCMFKNCTSLLELTDTNKLNIEKVTNMSYMFNGCSSLSNLSDISNWKTFNVTNMSNMFSGCTSLQSLPNISIWNTENVKNMNFMFYNCQNLKSFPEINNWNTNKMNGAIGIFSGCNENILPNITNWNIKNNHSNYNNNESKNPPCQPQSNPFQMFPPFIIPINPILNQNLSSNNINVNMNAAPFNNSLNIINENTINQKNDIKKKEKNPDNDNKNKSDKKKSVNKNKKGSFANNNTPKRNVIEETFMIEGIIPGIKKCNTMKFK